MFFSKKTTNSWFSLSNGDLQFELVCDEAKEVKNSISWQMAAVLVGACLAGQTSDLFGRRCVSLPVQRLI